MDKHSNDQGKPVKTTETEGGFNTKRPSGESSRETVVRRPLPKDIEQSDRDKTVVERPLPDAVRKESGNKKAGFASGFSPVSPQIGKGQEAAPRPLPPDIQRKLGDGTKTVDVRAPFIWAEESARGDSAGERVCGNCKRSSTSAFEYCPYCGNPFAQPPSPDRSEGPEANRNDFPGERREKPVDVAMVTRLIHETWPEWRVDALCELEASEGAVRAVRTDTRDRYSALIRYVSLDFSRWNWGALSDRCLPDSAIPLTPDNLVESIGKKLALARFLGHYENLAPVLDYHIHRAGDGLRYQVLICMKDRLRYNAAAEGGAGSRRLSGESELARMGIDLCDSLKVCHDNGLFPEQVEPERIYHCADTGRYCLDGIGFNRYFEYVVGDPSIMNIPYGPQLYRSPEWFASFSAGALNPYSRVREDIYTLGLTLYLLASAQGQHGSWAGPIDSAKLQSTVQRSRQGGALPSPANLSPGLWQVIRRACEPDPEDRFSSARAMGEALREAVEKGETPQEVKARRSKGLFSGLIERSPKW